MAERCLLHKSKLDEFECWCSLYGIETRPGKGEWQVLQVKDPKYGWQVVFDRKDSPEHYTINDKLRNLVWNFIKESNRLPPLPKPLTEEQCFMIEAAMHYGFKVANDDATMFKCSEDALVRLVTAVRDYPGKIVAVMCESKTEHAAVVFDKGTLFHVGTLPAPIEKTHTPLYKGKWPENYHG